MSTPTRQRIVEAGADLLRLKGYSGTGVKEIVAAAQAPFGSLYHHFPGGKEQPGAGGGGGPRRGRGGVGPRIRQIGALGLRRGARRGHRRADVLRRRRREPGRERLGRRL